MFDDLAGDALTKIWSTIDKKPSQIFKINLDNATDAYHRDDERHKFLTFLKLLPAHRTKFENAVDSMFIFVSVKKYSMESLTPFSNFQFVFSTQDPHQDLMEFTRNQDVQKIIVLDTIEEIVYYIVVQGFIMKVRVVNQLLLH